MQSASRESTQISQKVAIMIPQLRVSDQLLIDRVLQVIGAGVSPNHITPATPRIGQCRVAPAAVNDSNGEVGFAKRKKSERDPRSAIRDNALGRNADEMSAAVVWRRAAK